MTPIKIDFAPQSLRRLCLQRSPRSAIMVLLGLFAGVALCAYVVLASKQLAQAREAQQTSAQVAQQAALALTKQVVTQPTITISPSQADAVNHIIQRLNLPWRTLRDAVMLATPDTVAMLTLEPDVSKNMLRITAETKRSETMFSYIQALKKEAFFDSVKLTHHEINEQDPNKPIRFQIEAQWVTN